MNERYRPQVVVGTLQPTSNCDDEDLDELQDAIEETDFELQFGERNDSGTPVVRVVRPAR